MLLSNFQKCALIDKTVSDSWRLGFRGDICVCGYLQCANISYNFFFIICNSLTHSINVFYLVLRVLRKKRVLRLSKANVKEVIVYVCKHSGHYIKYSLKNTVARTCW